MNATFRRPILASGHRSRPAARPRRTPLALRLLAIPVTIAVVVFGLWLTGGVITNDFALAMWLSVAWMGFAGLLALVIAARSRAFRWPVLAAYTVTAFAIGAWLASSIFVDNVVNEQVATAAPPAAHAGRGAEPARPPKTQPSQNVLVRSGRFVSVRHSARGDARVIGLARGGRVLTLTNFEVDNGPDLRVYLVKGLATSEDEVDDFVDLGGLKGNKGNQQYEISADVDLRRYSTAVIWCRAFSVLFARAPLQLPE